MNIIKFQDFHKQQNHPVTIYADTESLNIKVNLCNKCNVTATEEHMKECECKNITESKQQLLSFGLYSVIADEYKNIFPSLNVTFSDENERNVHLKFIEIVKKYTTQVQRIIEETNIPYNNKLPFEMNNINECHICKGKIVKKDIVIDHVIDHDHLTGKIRGIAHKSCNFKFSLKGKAVHIIFHNFKKYDCRMLIESFGMGEVNVKPIVQNSENFKTVTLDWIKPMKKYNPKTDQVEVMNVTIKAQFIDSYAHLPASLNQLVKNLTTTKRKLKYVFRNLSKEFPKDEEFKLLLRKGVYPYDYMDNFEKLQETSLPPQEDFYNRLTDSNISDEDYQHAQKVWNVFKMKTLQDYHDLYLKTDILLLADVCETHKFLAMKYYNLNPWWYVTTPSFAWSAMLKKTNIKLEPIFDIDMYNFIMKAKRGGISFCPKKHAIANNIDIKDYDPTKPQTHILYFDCNNLYGRGMMEHLPISGFTWLKESQCKDILTKIIIEEENKIGYLLEVDILLPKSKHEDHSDFPLLPEHIKPPCEKHCETGNSENCLDCKRKNVKLINHHWNHYNYVVDSCYLRVALKNGYQVSKIHKVLQYNQSTWMKDYITFNTQRRNESKDEFSKDFFKLMNNSVYGGTLLQAEKFVNFEFVSTPEKFKKHFRFPENIKNVNIYKHCDFCNNKNSELNKCECIIGLEKRRKKTMITRPVYVGVKILEKSKAIMADLWQKINKKLGDRIQLIMSDTDSFLIQVESDNIYRDFYEKFQDDLDLSNCDFDGTPLPKHMDLNKHKKKVGKLKNELPPHPFFTKENEIKYTVIESVVALRSKCYSVKTNEEAWKEDNKEYAMKKNKGISKTNIKKITHENYKHVLQTGEIISVIERAMRSKNQQITFQLYNKEALNDKDDKRNILSNGVDTLPYGYEGPEVVKRDANEAAYRTLRTVNDLRGVP
jgi:hypothetical protein